MGEKQLGVEGEETAQKKKEAEWGGWGSRPVGDPSVCLWVDSTEKDIKREP